MLSAVCTLTAACSGDGFLAPSIPPLFLSLHSPIAGDCLEDGLTGGGGQADIAIFFLKD